VPETKETNNSRSNEGSAQVRLECKFLTIYNFGLESAVKKGSKSSRSEEPDLADEEDNSDDQLKIIKFADMDKQSIMVDRDSSPLSPMKRRQLGESTETDLSSRKNLGSGFGGFSLKTTVDINTNNFGAEL
jgi:hypothetical protein